MQPNTPCCADCHRVTYASGIMVSACVQADCYCHHWREQLAFTESLFARLATAINYRRSSLHHATHA